MAKILWIPLTLAAASLAACTGGDQAKGAGREQGTSEVEEVAQGATPPDTTGAAEAAGAAGAADATEAAGGAEAAGTTAKEAVEDAGTVADTGFEMPAPDSVEKLSIEGMNNTFRMGDLLFGGQPSEEVLLQLVDEGYMTILSTRGEGEIKWDERALLEEEGVTFIEIPMPKGAEIDDDMIALLDEALGTADRPMVLHCGSGNRVAGLYAAWLVETKGVPADRALELATSLGLTRYRPTVEKRLQKSP